MIRIACLYDCLCSSEKVPYPVQPSDSQYYIEKLAQKRLVEKKNLDHSTGERNHRKARMDYFLFLAQFLLFGRELGQHVGSPANITGDAVTIMFVKRGSLYDAHEQKDLEVGRPADRADRTEDIGVGVRLTRPVQARLLGDNSANGEHADATMLDLCPTCVVQVGLDVRTVEAKKEKSDL